MICRKCGHELADNAEYCEICGTSTNHDESTSFDNTAGGVDVRPPEIYDDLPADTGGTPKPRKRNLFAKIIAVLLIAVVLLCGLTVLGYYTFLPAKYTLLAAEYFTVQKAYGELKSSLERQERLADALHGTTVTSSTDFSLSVDQSTLTGLGLDEKTAGTVRDYLTNLSLNLTTGADMKGEKWNMSAVLSYKNNPGLSANLFLHGSDFGLNLPELSKTSIVGGLDDVRRLTEWFLSEYGFGDYDVMDVGDPWVMNRLQEEISVEYESLRELIGTYSRAFLDGLDDKDMTIERGRKVDLFGEETGCQVVTATLNRKAQKELLKTLLETAANDDNLYDLTVGKFKKIYEILSEDGSPYADLLDQLAGSVGVDIKKDLTKTNFKLAVLSIKNQINIDNLPEEMIIRFYIKGLHIVKREIEVPIADVGKAVIAFEKLIERDSVKSGFVLSADDPSGGTYTLKVMRQYDKVSDTRDETYELSVSAEGVSPMDICYMLDIRENPEGGGSISRKTDYSFSAKGNNPTFGSWQYGLDISSDGTVKRNKDGPPEESEYKIDVVLHSLLFPQEIKFTLGVVNETVYGKKIDLPGWAARNTIDLGTATDEELYSYFEEIDRNLSLLKMVLGIQ